MRYGIEAEFEGKSITGSFGLIELVGKIEKMVDEHGTGKKEEKRQGSG